MDEQFHSAKWAFPPLPATVCIGKRGRWISPASLAMRSNLGIHTSFEAIPIVGISLCTSMEPFAHLQKLQLFFNHDQRVMLRLFHLKVLVYYGWARCCLDCLTCISKIHSSISNPILIIYSDSSSSSSPEISAFSFSTLSMSCANSKSSLSLTARG